MTDDSLSSKSKVRRNNIYSETDVEIVLEPVGTTGVTETIVATRLDSPAVVVAGPTPGHSIDSIMQELRDAPSKAVELVQFLGKITKGWEPIGSNGNPVNEVPVPPGKNPRDFVRAATSTVHISGFRLTTIFGDEVASIMKDSPKWRVTVLGEYQIDTPFVHHGSKAEANAKEFAESKLRDLGYIIG